MPSQEELDAEYSGSDLEAKVRRLESTVNGLMESGLDRLLASGYLQFEGIPLRWNKYGMQVKSGTNPTIALSILNELVASEPTTEYPRASFGGFTDGDSGTAYVQGLTSGTNYASIAADANASNVGSRTDLVAGSASAYAYFLLGLNSSIGGYLELNNARLQLNELASDPGSIADGGIYYYNDKLYARINGATVELGASGGGMTTPALLAAPALDKTVNLAAPAAAAWTTANKAVYVPFELSDDRAVTEVIFNKGVVAGNVNVALYNEDAAGLPGARIGSALGSTAVSAGANAPQVLNITDQALSAGRYFVGIVFDTITTLTLTSWGGSSATTPLVGVYTEASAFTLPATATPVSPTGNLRIPALLVRTV